MALSAASRQATVVGNRATLAGLLLLLPCVQRDFESENGNRRAFSSDRMFMATWKPVVNLEICNKQYKQQQQQMANICIDTEIQRGRAYPPEANREGGPVYEKETRSSRWL